MIFSARCTKPQRHWRGDKIRHFAAVQESLLASFGSFIGVTIWLLVTCGGQAGAAAQTLGADRPFLQADLGLSILGEAGQREHLAQSFAVGVRGGTRWGRWGLFGQVEPAYWRVSNMDGTKEPQGTLNLGVGGEMLSGGGLVRTALSVGPSILTRAGDLDQPGTTGFFFDLRPMGLRWLIAERVVLGFDPISLTLMVPVLEGIPLIELEYRTTITGEYVF